MYRHDPDTHCQKTEENKTTCNKPKNLECQNHFVRSLWDHNHGLESIIQLMVKFSPIVNVIVENVSLQKSESEFLHFSHFRQNEAEKWKWLFTCFHISDKMKQKSEGIGLVVGRVQRIEEEAANASLKVTVLIIKWGGHWPAMAMFLPQYKEGVKQLFLHEHKYVQCFLIQWLLW